MYEYWIFLIISILIASFSQILLKSSTLSQHKSLMYEYLNPKVVMGYSMMFISTILVIFAYKKIPYRSGPILESTEYIYVMLLSKWILHEKLTRYKVVGNLLILLGVFIYFS
jgi:small multidrug resistance pump